MYIIWFNGNIHMTDIVYKITYENVNNRFTTVRKYIVSLSPLISLSLTLANHCLSGLKLEWDLKLLIITII